MVSAEFGPAMQGSPGEMVAPLLIFGQTPNLQSLSVPSPDRTEQKQPANFFEAIGRPEIGEILGERSPWAYWTMEIYRNDIRGQGGLGMLASDTLEIARKEEIPAVFVTPFYPVEAHQGYQNLQQIIDRVHVTPEERGFQKSDDVEIVVIVDGKPVPTRLNVYEKQEGSVTLLVVTEPNFGELYQGETNGGHRLYQEVALGFGGYKAVKQKGLQPAMNQQLNEAPTVFSALARLDELSAETGDFETSLATVRDKTIYTNHTLVQAVEAEYALDQFERFVIPNIRSEEVREWLRDRFHGKGDRLKLSLLAIDLSGKRNGVSLIHAREASKVYVDYDGKPVRFESVTNGISLERWGDPNLLAYYVEMGVLDRFGLVTGDYAEMIDKADNGIMEGIKEENRRGLREYLKTRRNQYGMPVEIPDESMIFNWRRRMAGYKRPQMIFERPEELAEILESSDAYLIIGGKAHPEDGAMQGELSKLLSLVDGHPVLKQRVHFMEDYDEPLARALVRGADISINTSTVRDAQGNRISTEACGTSWEKDILGNTILISTDDGGVADLRVRAEEEGIVDFQPPYLEVTGKSYQEEVNSLYGQMRKAVGLIEQGQRIPFAKGQLKGYLPIISGARMEADYLNLAFAA